MIAPVPGGSLTSAEARYLSPYGEVRSGWEKNGSEYRFTVVIPANCTADIILPGGRTEAVTAG